MTYYAHSDPNQPGKLPNEDGARWQPLHRHLLRVAWLSRRFACNARRNDGHFAETAKWAGLLHDFGKYQDEFQQMLFASARGETSSRVLHSVYGAAHALEAKHYDIALSVLGHHAGLHAATELKGKVSEAHRKIAKELLEEIFPDANSRRDSLASLESYSSQSGAPNSLLDVRVRMLFSCLIDADRWDTARLSGNQPPLFRPLNAQEKLSRLLNHIQAIASQQPSGILKDLRTELLNTCLDRASIPERLLSLAVPTGGGKTLASLAFALQRACQRPDEVDRIIVVIPFLSIIEQTVQAYKSALGDEDILEHHSAIADSAQVDEGSQEDIANPVSRSLKLAVENWDAPIVVTTSVRFFESLYSNRPSDLRRIHNIARSVVILDEVQTLPRCFLRTFLSFMKGLADEWHTTFLFCTATQPAFEQTGTSEDEANRWPKGTIQPLLPEELQSRLYANLQRVREPEWPKDGQTIAWEVVAERLAQYPRVLCIVNKKKHAKHLYEIVKALLGPKQIPANNLFHLSTRMCAEHRLSQINEIKKNLSSGDQPCFVISTQLVEAGVDLDFPVVFRALAPLDSIVQAAGRCDREGQLTEKLKKPAGEFHIFLPEDNGYIYREALDVTRSMIERGNVSIHNAAHIHTYFNELYAGELDTEDIEPLRYNLNFPEVAKRLNMIDNLTHSVLIPYNDKGKEIIHQILSQHSIDRSLLRRAQRYQVGLYDYEFKSAKEEGSIYEIVSESNLWACHEDCYSAELGLEIRPPNPEAFIV